MTAAPFAAPRLPIGETNPGAPAHAPWIVVGGGLLGMSVADTLAQRGCAVTLLESASQVGGLASAWQLGGVTWDRHYHVTLFSDAHTCGLLRDLDLDRAMRWQTVRTGFYGRGRHWPFSTAWDFARFPLLGPIEKTRLLTTIFRASRITRWEPLRALTVEEWLTRLGGPSVFQKFWKPLLLAKLGEEYRTTAATFIWATIQRMYAARKSGGKKELFGYLPGGYARLLGAFEARLHGLGVATRTSAPVADVRRDSSGRLQVRLQDGSMIEGARVIVTTPAPVAARICPQLAASEKAALERIAYVGILCTSVLLERPLSNCYITNIADSSIPFTGLIEMSALVDRAEFGHRTLVYLPRYLPANDPAFGTPDHTIEEQSRRALEKMHPSLRPSDMVAVRTSRARYVFPRPVAGEGAPLLPVDTSVPGLSIVNSAHIQNGTLNANETIALARKEASRIYALSAAR